MNNNSGIHILYDKLILSIIFKHYFNDLSIEIIKKVHLSVKILREKKPLLRWNNFSRTFSWTFEKTLVGDAEFY